MLPISGQLAAVRVAFFALAVPPVGYVLVKHGKRGLLGWVFLLAFCMLRLVGEGMTLQAVSQGRFSVDGAIVSQVGLSPLCFAMAGVAHEAATSVAHRSRIILGWPQYLLAHVVTATSLALLIVGALNSAEPGQTPDQVHSAVSLMRVGSVLFLVVFVLVAVQVVVSFRQSRSVASERLLLIATAAAMPEFFLRILYLVLGAMINSPSWSVLLGGTLAEQVVLELLPEFLIVLVLVAGGIATRSLPYDRAAAQDGGHSLPVAMKGSNSAGRAVV